MDTNKKRVDAKLKKLAKELTSLIKTLQEKVQIRGLIIITDYATMDWCHNNYYEKFMLGQLEFLKHKYLDKCSSHQSNVFWDSQDVKNKEDKDTKPIHTYTG